MAETSVSQQNWVAGELSPNMRGRFDVAAYANGAERFVNFISELAGPARFRSGTQYVNPTRRNQIGCLIPFVFNEEQAYQLEFTQGYIRFYQNDQIITLTALNITGVTKANPGVITSASHGLSNGDEVIINAVVGMTQLNSRNFVVANVTTNTFTLKDVFGVTDLNTTSYTTYVSGGTISKIYEITTPYQGGDLFALKIGQNADVMYIVHPGYEPMKLTRSGTTSWTIAKFDRTGDPFLTKKTISGVTAANPAVVTATGHGLSTGDVIIINAVVGMTELNNSLHGTQYTITKIDADSFSLNGIDSSAYTAYSSAGYASLQNLLPGAIAFYQGRLFYGYSGASPESIWGSKPLDANGDPQYDDLTVGATAADALKFTLSPVSGKVDKIQSLVPTLNFLAICTLEGISKCDGGTAGDPISPSTIDITPAVTQGVLQQITPILLGINLIYTHRSGLIIYSLEYDIFYSAYNAIDLNLSNEQITQSGLTQFVYRNGRPPVFFTTRNDGVLVGITYKSGGRSNADVNGAHRHIIGGTSSKVLSVGNQPRTMAYDQTWLIVERVVNGQTVRYVEFINDEVLLPERDDYFTGADNETTDDATWRNAVFEAQKQYIYTDANLTYDGSDYATVTLTPGALTGNSVTFTAGGSVFTSAMVGQELWKKSVNGVGTGRAIITAYISATQVTCNIETDFDTVTAMPIDGWYLTTNIITNAWHLEGEVVGLLTDGGEHAEQTVTNGTIHLQYQASTVHLGKVYLGLIKSMSIEGGAEQGAGPSQGKTKIINRMDVHFLNTLGAKYGSSLYTLQDVEFRSVNDSTGRPSPPFTGIKNLSFEDISESEKHIYIVQDSPLPCTVLSAIPFLEVSDD